MLIYSDKNVTVTHAKKKSSPIVLLTVLVCFVALIQCCCCFYISMSGNRVGGFQNLLGSPPQSGGIQELDEPVPDRKTLYTGDWRCL